MNRLVDELSPYLRQHRDQPVDWYPWSDEAFARARERDVPILLSVGYAACHWCHVMSHECFDDPEVADAMNTAFVNVKVDREERPDIDAAYMEAVQAMTGRGGWPMTVLLHPDGRPFWGGTYLPRDRFLEVIAAVRDAWSHRRHDLEQNSEQLLSAVGANHDTAPLAGVPGLDTVNSILSKLAGAFDPEWGGFGSPPKFPSPHHLELVLRIFMSSRSDDARKVVTTTLDAMASGGMYDHVAGGFARYATDRQWLVPHFEKMLYDQALLVRIYRQAATVFANPTYRQVVEETIEYVLRDLRHPDGGFFSAQDADSPDASGRPVEGLFATWTIAEVESALAELDPTVIAATLEWFGIDEAGNFEGRSIPNRIHARGRLRRPDSIETARQQLLDARSRRPAPPLDDMVITEWNALFLHALADAAAVFQRDDWTAAAIANGEFLLDRLRGPDGRWFRSWHPDGTSATRPAATSADLAAVIEAFIRLHELTGRAKWIDAARSVADSLLDWYWDPVDGGLYTTPDDGEQLFVRRKDLLDDATPSANSTAANGLFRLAALTGEQRYANQADRILQVLGAVAERMPGAMSNGLLAIELRHRGLVELAIVGDAPRLVRVAHQVWRPDLVLTWGEPFDSPLWHQRTDGMAYLCRGSVCERPVDTPEALFEQIAGTPLPEGIRL
ncbi:MAG: thioredoxin domain-containing protein [Ilumatobacteraceae bacterium]